MWFDIEINADASLLGVFPVVLSKTPSHMVCLIPVKLLVVYVIQTEQIEFTLNKEGDEFCVGGIALSECLKLVQNQCYLFKKFPWIISWALLKISLKLKKKKKNSAAAYKCNLLFKYVTFT